MEKLTLAQFVSNKREQVGLSQQGLSLRANLPLEMVEAIESGQELFLPSTIRQKLAKELKVEPKQIKSYEKDLPIQGPAENRIEVLKHRILDGVLEDNICPVCGEKLVCRIAKMYDLEDNLVLHPKARCSKCPFQLK